MKALYIAGPYRGKNSWEVEQNIQRAESYIEMIAKCGILPVCPHTMFRNFDGTMTGQWWLDATAQLLVRCDGIFLVDGWRNSAGSLSELEMAKGLGMDIFAHDESLVGFLPEWATST